MRLAEFTMKERMLFLLALLAALGVWENGAGAAVQLAVGVAVAVLADGALTFARSRRWFWSQSAAISGLIIAMVLALGSPVVVAGAAAVAMLAKHFVRAAGKHVFNPAALGIAVGLVAGVSTAWWATGSLASLALIGAGGLLMAWRMRRLHQAAAFFAVNDAIAAGYALAVGRPLLATLLAYSPLFFALVMLAEPVTAPLRRNGRVAYAALAAALAWAFGLALPRVDPFVAALLLCNLARLGLDRMARPAPGPGLAAPAAPAATGVLV